jgi:hypothetical protein
MAAKDIILRRRLIKEGIILAVLLAALSVGGYMLSDYDDDTQSEKQARESENSALRAEHSSILQELGTGFEVSAFYETYIRNHSSTLLLDRGAASQWLGVLREKNHLANLSVTISPITDASMESIRLKSGVLTKSDIHLTFGAISDNSIYSFIEALQRTLPGIVAIRELKFIRNADLSKSTVLELSQHRITPLVSGELSFVWLGIRPADDAKTAASPAGSVR